MESDRNTALADDGTHILQFLRAYDVICPNCSAKAHVKIIEAGPGAMEMFAPRRLSCAFCGHSSEWRSNGVIARDLGPIDWYFKATFWHRRHCCGQVLWVTNREHLHFLRNYVGAKLRAHVKTSKGWSNSSLSGRLPRWISSGRNRGKILKALDEIEQDMKEDAT